MNYTVVGGGISGLATAYYLKSLPNTKRVIVLEATKRLGGWIQTTRWFCTTKFCTINKIFSFTIGKTMEFCTSTGQELSCPLVSLVPTLCALSKTLAWPRRSSPSPRTTLRPESGAFTTGTRSTRFPAAFWTCWHPARYSGPLWYFLVSGIYWLSLNIVTMKAFTTSWPGGLGKQLRTMPLTQWLG